MQKYCSAIAATLLLALSLPALAADAPAKRDDSASEKAGIKLSLQCWTYNKLTAFEAIDKAAMLGIKYVEFFPGQKMKPDGDAKMSQNMSDEQIDEIKKKLADAGGLKAIAWGVDGIPTDEAGVANASKAPRSSASKSSSPKPPPTPSSTSLPRNSTSASPFTITPTPGRPRKSSRPPRTSPRCAAPAPTPATG